jgi:hypothetical protein
MAKEFRRAVDRGASLGLNSDELAFYDALVQNEASVHVLGDDTLKLIAQELTRKLKASASVDWSKWESARPRVGLQPPKSGIGRHSWISRTFWAVLLATPMNSGLSAGYVPGRCPNLL